MLWPAVRHPAREAAGHFIPFAKGRVHLVSRRGDALALRSTASLLASPLRTGVVVNSYSYGPAYDALVQALSQQQRLTSVRDVSTALRMLAAGRIDFAILNPTAVYGEAREANLAPTEAFHLELLTDLPPFDIGAYVSRHAMTEPRQRQLVAALESLKRSGEVERALRRHYPESVLALEALP